MGKARSHSFWSMGERGFGAGLRRGLWVALACEAALSPRAATADDDFEARINAELLSQSSEASALFKRANEARERRDLTTARDLYAEVRRIRPAFFHATRRQCGVERWLGHRTEAIALCREALEVGGATTENLNELARTLLAGDANHDELTEVRGLVARALRLSPKDLSTHDVACELALWTADKDKLRVEVRAMEQIAPGDRITLLRATMLAGMEGRIDDGEDLLEKAHKAGRPEEIYTDLSRKFQEARPWPYRALAVAWKVVASWFGGFGLLLLTGGWDYLTRWLQTQLISDVEVLI